MNAAAQAQAQRPKPEQTAQWRCRRCGRLLAIGAIAPGTSLEIKCKCNHVNVLP